MGARIAGDVSFFSQCFPLSLFQFHSVGIAVRNRSADDRVATGAQPHGGAISGIHLVPKFSLLFSLSLYSHCACYHSVLRLSTFHVQYIYCSNAN